MFNNGSGPQPSAWFKKCLPSEKSPQEKADVDKSMNDQWIRNTQNQSGMWSCQATAYVSPWHYRTWLYINSTPVQLHWFQWLAYMEVRRESCVTPLFYMLMCPGSFFSFRFILGIENESRCSNNSRSQTSNNSLLKYWKDKECRVHKQKITDISTVGKVITYHAIDST